jgi:hypothetical protein
MLTGVKPTGSLSAIDIGVAFPFAEASPRFDMLTTICPSGLPSVTMVASEEPATAFVSRLGTDL